MREMQLPIKFEHTPLFDREDFMVSKSNIEAISIVDSWPNWSFFAACIYGPEGCGKTHIAHIFADNVYAKSDKFTNKIPFIKASNISLDTPHKLFEMHRCLVVEDLDENVDMEAMFHLYNLYKNENGYILFTSKKAPAHLNFSLKDLSSRLNAIPSIEIKEPDDELLSILILKLFSDRQINISPDVIKYMINNAPRSFSYIKKLVEESDLISFSKKRAISIPIIKEAMNYLKNDKQINLL